MKKPRLWAWYNLEIRANVNLTEKSLTSSLSCCFVKSFVVMFHEMEMAEYNVSEKKRLYHRSEFIFISVDVSCNLIRQSAFNHNVALFSQREPDQAASSQEAWILYYLSLRHADFVWHKGCDVQRTAGHVQTGYLLSVVGHFVFTWIHHRLRNHNIVSTQIYSRQFRQRWNVITNLFNYSYTF